MKKLLLIILILIVSINLFAATQKEYKVVLRSDWKPYNFINQQGKPDGYAVELFSLIAKEANIKFSFVMVEDFQEAIKMLEEGRVDIVPNISIDAKRESLLLFTQPTDDFMINIYKHKNNSTIISLEDVENKKVGLVKNNICAKLIHEKYKSIEAVYYAYYKDMMQGLEKKEVDVFCYPKPLIEYENKEHTSNIVSLNKSFMEIKRGVGVTKSNFDLLPFLDEAISDLKLTGKLDALHEKWFKKEKFIELTRSETLFLLISFFGIAFTSFVIMVYYVHKKKWLMTNEMLKKEVEKQTLKYKEQNKELQKLQEKLKEQLNKDALTDVFNRNCYNIRIQEQFALYKRHHTPFSFLMFDIDDFKKINDNYGHDMGDKVLIQLCQLVQQHIRITDNLFRIGGEEFVVLFANTNLEEAKLVAQKLCEIIEDELNVLNDKKITVSMGLTQVHTNDTVETIFKRADELLYDAKHQGKNRVISK
jgi:diguanylate cyclase (GGDEF)-like protein